MKTDVEIAGHDLIVEYEIKITSHGYPATGPTYSSGGEPGAGAEFDIEILGLRFPKQHADYPELVIPTWLKDILTTHLLERDDINDIAQRMDHERGERDPDDARDERLDREADRDQAQDDEA